ncbi:MAG: HlyD family type I secretion periplasmic adaptor subunit [Victivallaceae bacterium]|jgi:HlyD family secretion protein
MSDKTAKTLTPEMLDYQPDAIELEHSGLPWLGRYGILSVLVFFVLAIIWASVCHVDKIVIANGKLIASTNNIVMKPLERSVIKKVNVEVGQTVSKDQTLITFDQTFNQADVDQLKEQLRSLKAQANRMRAEFMEKDYLKMIDPNNRDEVWQASIFAKRTKFYTEKMAYYAENIKRLNAMQDTTRQSVAKQQERLETLLRIEKMLEGLQERKTVSLKQLLETQISRLQMESETDNLRNKLNESDHEILSEKAGQNSFVAEWYKSITEEMVKTERELNTVKKDLEKAERLNSLIFMRSPMDAVVLDIAQFSEGSAVREAEPLVTLVPVDAKIEAEVNVEPKDIGQVKINDDVRIKLDSFQFQIHGTLLGKVRIISEDTFQEQGASGAKQNFYRARIIISGKLDNVPKNFRLIPGMQVTAEIKVGKRRIITYLLHPLVKALDESIREP